jgi:predicted ATPase/DNA-binding SARP family transcriptional activator/predicted negative regulator of RcsB-dependent stress response
VILKRRKALGLLAYLAVSGRRHDRDALATLFWPDHEPSRAHANLRNLLWIIRQDVAAESLVADHDGIELRTGADVWLDVAEFRSRVSAVDAACGKNPTISPENARRLSEAVSIYRDHFLSSFSLADNPEFEEWQMRQEDTFRAHQATALGRLVQFHEKCGDADEAIRQARRWLALDPLAEPAQRRLMSLFARSGQRGAALELYDKSARLIETKLGLTIASETTALRDRILAGELTAQPRQAESLAPRHRIPRPPTPFVGRERELARIRQLLADPEHTLVTLVGPGGCGKTRLAMEAAGQRLADFPGGVYFVPLAPVKNAEFVVAAVEAAIQAPAASPGSEKSARSRDPLERQQARLLDYLREKRILLVVDNLEHLVGGLGLFSEILREAPGVKLLATSREQLHLTGETIVELEGLPFPAPDVATGRLRSFGAVQLFLQHARRLGSGFSPSVEDLKAVGAICRVLQGSPLGVELAASWVGTLSCEEISAEVASNLDFLTARRHDIPARHRSLRNVFDHSWRLLSPDEKRCFRRLALFRGEFSRAAALSVGGCSLPALAALADKSLLRRSDGGFLEIHESVRQYAEEKLRAAPREYEGTGERLGAFYLAHLANVEEALKSKRQKATLRELAREVANWRAAWLRAVAQRDIPRLTGAALSLFLFHDIGSRFEEGAQLFGRAADEIGEDEKPEHRRLAGMLRTAQGWFVACGAPARGRELVGRGLDLLEPLGQGRDLAFARVVGAIVGVWATQKETREKLTDAISVFEEASDDWGSALALEALGFFLRNADPPTALRHARRSLLLRRRLGDEWGITLALHILGCLAEARGLPHVARKHYRESMLLRRRLGQDEAGVMSCLAGLARASRRAGNTSEALRHARECLNRAREMGNCWFIANSLIHIGLIEHDLGESTRARAHLEEALPLVELVAEPAWSARLFSLLGNVTLTEGDRVEARCHLEQAAAHPAPELGSVPGDFLTGAASLELTDPAPTNGFASSWQELGLGRLAAEESDVVAARAHLIDALERARQENDEPTSLEILVELARVEVAKGRHEQAAELLGLALDHPSLSPRARTYADHALQSAASTLPAVRLEDALARGRLRGIVDTARELRAGA